MVRAALAAVAVAHLEGVSVDDARARGSRRRRRLQAVELSNGATLLRDDYKAPVETIDAARPDVLEEIPARRRIVVLGDIDPPNPQHATYRRIAERVGRIATHFFVAGRMMKDYRPGARIRPGCLMQTSSRPAKRRAKRRRSSRRCSSRATSSSSRDATPSGWRASASLLRQGRTVRCDIRSCHLRAVTCDACPMLERGWGSHRVVM